MFVTRSTCVPICWRSSRASRAGVRAGPDRQELRTGGTVATMTSDDLFDTVLRSRSDVGVAMQEAHDAALAAVDSDLLELSRRLVVSMLGGPVAVGDEISAGWSSSLEINDRERACLAFCEQFVIDVASMGDELPAAVASQLGPDGLSDYANALLVIEQRERLRLTWQLLGSGSRS